MKKKYTIYDTIDGLALRQGECIDIALGIQAGDDEVLFGGHTASTDWYNPVTSQLEPLNEWTPSMVAASQDIDGTAPSGVDIVMQGLPQCYFVINGERYTIADGAATLKAPAPGYYFIELRIPSYPPILGMLEVLP